MPARPARCVTEPSQRPTGCGLFGRVLAARHDVPRPSTRDAVNGLELYRENIAARLADPPDRRTDIPVQVLAPVRDPSSRWAMATEIDAYVGELWVRRLAGGHWVPRHRPEVIARCVRELAAHVEGGRRRADLK